MTNARKIRRIFAVIATAGALLIGGSQALGQARVIEFTADSDSR
jgi:hypothetical protein